MPCLCLAPDDKKHSAKGGGIEERLCLSIPFGFCLIRPRVQYLFQTATLVSHKWTNEYPKPTHGILSKHHCELRQISSVHASAFPRRSNGLALLIQNVW